MPYYLIDYCSGSGSWCNRATAQQWEIIWTDFSTTGWMSVANPVQGTNWDFLNHIGTLQLLCVETSDYEDYQCSVGTGGQWGSWTLTVKY